jgi:uncharacterized membrane protein YkgB
VAATYDSADLPTPPPGTTSDSRLLHISRAIALAGVVLPLLMIGLIKFQQYEIDALKPLFAATPWLAWLPALLGNSGASYFLGSVEIATAALFVASLWSPRAGVAAGALGTIIFALTTSILLAMPIWETSAGGFPWLNGTGSFLIKDIALLGISLVVLAESLAKTRRPSNIVRRSRL